MSAASAIDDGVILSEAVRLVNEGVEVTFPVNGRSMRPFIEGGRDSVVLVNPGEIKRFDVVLARTDDGRHVVHRVLAVEGDRVTLMGDGNLCGREHCKVDDILAKVTHVVRPGGVRRPLDSASMRLAVKLWVAFLPFRRILLKLYRVKNRITDR